MALPRHLRNSLLSIQSDDLQDPCTLCELSQSHSRGSGRLSLAQIRSIRRCPKEHGSGELARVIDSVASQLMEEDEKYAQQAEHPEREAALRRRLHATDEKLQRHLSEHLLRSHTRSVAMAVHRQAIQSAQAAQWLPCLVHALFMRTCTAVLRRRQSLRVLNRHFLYCCLYVMRRKRAIRAREGRIAALEASMTEPPPRDVLRATVAALAPLPDATLDALRRGMTKRCFLLGEVVTLERQAAEGALFLHRGKVHIRHDAAPKSHAPAASPSRKSKESGTDNAGGGAGATDLSAINTPWWCVAGTSLLGPETHEVSLYADAEGAAFYYLSSATFADIVEPTLRADPELRLTLLRLADARRAHVMKRLTDASMRQASPLFERLSPDGLAQLIRVAKPRVYRKEDVMIPRGSYGKVAVIIVSGRAELLQDDKRIEVLREGSAAGEIAAYTGKREPTVMLKALGNHVDVWCIDRRDLIAALLHEDLLAIMPALLAMVDENGKEKLAK